MKLFILIFNLLILIQPAHAVMKPLSPTVYYTQVMNMDKKCLPRESIVTFLDAKYMDIGPRALNSRKNKPITACQSVYKKCAIEGSCALVNSRGRSLEQLADENIEIINYQAQGKNTGRYYFSHIEEDRCPYGLGVKKICLDPFFTVAADLNFYKAGDVIYVSALEGVKLPTGEVHDGYMIVRDRGGAIKGANRFDFYSGFLPYRHPKNVFFEIGLANEKNKEIFFEKVTDDKVIEEVHLKRNYPLVPIENTQESFIRSIAE